MLAALPPYLPYFGGVLAVFGLLSLPFTAFEKPPLLIRCLLGGLAAAVTGGLVVTALQVLPTMLLIMDVAGFLCGGALIASANFPIAKFGKMAPVYLFLFSILLASYVNLLTGIILLKMSYAPTFSWLAAALIALGGITLMTLATQFFPKRPLQIIGYSFLSVGSIVILISVVFAA